MKSRFSNIIKSKNDLRKYQIITLQNDLQCLLIQDNQTEKSAAAMNVNCGYLQDPKHIPGLAHFLEHMLFLGTEKYPNENEYKSYLSQNGGSSNAYTSAMETNYYFSVRNDAIEGALDRFSQFFISPLFTESCTNRELQAVDSEHTKNLQQDNWRNQHLFRSSGKEGNPFTKFSTGNLETLKRDDIREQLLDFYRKSYSSNLMKLVVYSKEDIEVQEKWCQEMFQEIKNYQLEKPKYSDVPFDQENMGEFWQIFPVMKKDILEFKWVVEYQHQYYKDIPIYQISHLIGHEGENSLLSMLKEQGLAVGLSSGHGDFMGCFSMFTVSVNLTKKGLQNLEQIQNILFEYLRVLREKGGQEWIHKEIQMINQIQFDTKANEKPDNYVVTLASRLQNYQEGDILYAPYMHENFDKELIQKTVDSLKIDNLRVYLHSKLVEDSCDQVEPIYNIKYKRQKLTDKIRNIYQSPKLDFETNLRLDLPVQNPFLPKSLQILEKPEIIEKYPQKIDIKENMRVWYKQDTEFLTPKVSVYLKIFSMSEKFLNSQMYRSYASIFQEQFKFKIQEFKYMADMANISSSVSTPVNGIDVIVAGFNDSIPDYTKQLFNKLGEFRVDNKQQFENIYQKKKQYFDNFFSMVPYAQIGSYQQALMQDATFEPEFQRDIVYKLNYEDYLEFYNQYLNTLSYEGLVLGNISEQKSKEFLEDAIQNLEKGLQQEGQKQIQKQNLEQLESVRCIKLQPKKAYFYEKLLESEKEQNSGISVYFQYKETCIKDQLLVNLLVQYLQEPCFSQLRTVEQLGYIVQCSQMSYRGVLGVQFLLQSSVKGPMYLGQRVDMFVENVQEKLLLISDQEFEKYRQALMTHFIQKDTSIFQEAQRYVQEIDLVRYQFDRRQQQIEVLKQITKEEFLECFKQIFIKQRKQIETHLVCKQHQEENDKVKEKRVKNTIYGFEQIKSVQKFKKGMELYPDNYFRANF